MKKKLVSVIIPAYNASNYIEKCILSVINQTYENIEIIIIDDGSTDSTYKRCCEMKKRDARIRIYHQDNIGLVRTRKASIKFVKGEYIMFVDADDWIDCNMIECMIDCFEQDKVDICSCNIKLEGNQFGMMKNSFLPGYYGRKEIEEYVINNMICTNNYFTFGILPTICGKLFRKDIFYKYENRVCNEITLGEDAACVYPMIYKEACIFLCENAYYHYFRNDDSMTLGFSRNQIQGSIKLISYLVSEFSDSVSAIDRQLDYYIYSLTENNILNSLKANSKNDFYESWNEMKEYVKKVDLKKSIRRTGLQKVPFKSGVLVWMCSNCMIYLIILYQCFRKCFYRRR